MKLGFIGTGKITSSVVTGICRSKISFKKIILSPRNRNIAKKLNRKFRKVSIAKNNQEIINSCNWIFLAVTPTVGQKIIKNLKFKSTQTIISFISTMTLPQLKKAIKEKKGTELIKIFSGTKSVRKEIVKAGQDTEQPNFGRKNN